MIWFSVIPPTPPWHTKLLQYERGDADEYRYVWHIESIANDKYDILWVTSNVDLTQPQWQSLGNTSATSAFRRDHVNKTDTYLGVWINCKASYGDELTLHHQTGGFIAVVRLSLHVVQTYVYTKPGTYIQHPILYLLISSIAALLLRWGRYCTHAGALIWVKHTRRWEYITDIGFGTNLYIRIYGE